MADDIRRLGGEVRLRHAGRPDRGRGRTRGRRSTRAASARGRRRHLVAAAAHDLVGLTRPARARDRSGGRPGPALPRLPDRRARRSTARTSSRTTGSTSTSRACRSGGSRTSARGARGWCPTPTRPASGSSTSASRATSSGRRDDDELVELATRELEQLGLAAPTRSSAATPCACPRRTRCTTPTTPSAWPAIRDWLDRDRQPPAGRAQRPAPLQQLGPLDAHRDARGGEPARRAAARHLGRQRRVRLPRGATWRTSSRTARRRRLRRWPSPSPPRADSRPQSCAQRSPRSLACLRTRCSLRRG